MHMYNTYILLKKFDIFEKKKFPVTKIVKNVFTHILIILKRYSDTSGIFRQNTVLCRVTYLVSMCGHVYELFLRFGFKIYKVYFFIMYVKIYYKNSASVRLNTFFIFIKYYIKRKWENR